MQPIVPKLRRDLVEPRVLTRNMPWKRKGASPFRARPSGGISPDERERGPLIRGGKSDSDPAFPKPPERNTVATGTVGGQSLTKGAKGLLD